MRPADRGDTVRPVRVAPVVLIRAVDRHVIRDGPLKSAGAIQETDTRHSIVTYQSELALFSGSMSAVADEATTRTP